VAVFLALAFGLGFALGTGSRLAWASALAATDFTSGGVVGFLSSLLAFEATSGLVAYLHSG